MSAGSAEILSTPRIGTPAAAEPNGTGSTGMPSDVDLWRTAWIIAEQYGAEGIDFAAQMAQSFEIGGKSLEQEVWLAIMHKVEEITRGEGGSALQ